MRPTHSFDQTIYYRQQASACAAAAVVSTVAHVKQAYLDLEQGWLCLVPKPEQPVPKGGSVSRDEKELPLHTAPGRASRAAFHTA